MAAFNNNFMVQKNNFSTKTIFFKIFYSFSAIYNEKRKNNWCIVTLQKHCSLNKKPFLANIAIYKGYITRTRVARAET